MHFEKGEPLPRRGGAENGLKGGWPTRLQQAVKRVSGELAQQYFERLDTYLWYLNQDPPENLGGSTWGLGLNHWRITDG